MFERFTDRARRAVVLAQEQSRLLNQDHLGTEHILLGLLWEEEGIAAQALKNVGLTFEEVERRVPRGNSSPSGHIPFTELGKKALELSLREALQLGHNYIGTEHILLGMIRNGEGTAIDIFEALGVNPSDVRREVIHLLSNSLSPVAADRRDKITSRMVTSTDRVGRTINMILDSDWKIVGVEKKGDEIIITIDDTVSESR